MKIILGSQSKNRQEVLRRAGISFVQLSADIDEKAIRTNDYEQLPLLIANAKADALVAQISEPALLVTADTVTVYDAELREKPASPEEARRFLETYSEIEPIKVITGVTVTNTTTGRRVEGRDISKIAITALPPELIDELVNDSLTYTLAGGFTPYDERLLPYFVSIEGSQSSIGGLPLDLLQRLLSEAAE